MNHDKIKFRTTPEKSIEGPSMYDLLIKRDDEPLIDSITCSSDPINETVGKLMAFLVKKKEHVLRECIAYFYPGESLGGISKRLSKVTRDGEPENEYWYVDFDLPTETLLIKFLPVRSTVVKLDNNGKSIRYQLHYETTAIIDK